MNLGWNERGICAPLAILVPSRSGALLHFLLQRGANRHKQKCTIVKFFKVDAEPILAIGVNPSE